MSNLLQARKAYSESLASRRFREPSFNPFTTSQKHYEETLQAERRQLKGRERYGIYTGRQTHGNDEKCFSIAHVDKKTRSTANLEIYRHGWVRNFMIENIIQDEKTPETHQGLRQREMVYNVKCQENTCSAIYIAEFQS